MYTGLCFSIQIITVMLTQEHRLDIIGLVKSRYAFHTNFYISYIKELYIRVSIKYKFLTVKAISLANV